MSDIGLADVIAALRSELTKATERAQEEAVQLIVREVTLQLQVVVTKTGEGKAGINFWVVALGTSGQTTAQSTQTITLVLASPTDSDGQPLKVASRSYGKPE